MPARIRGQGQPGVAPFGLGLFRRSVLVHAWGACKPLPVRLLTHTPALRIRQKLRVPPTLQLTEVRRPLGGRGVRRRHRRYLRRGEPLCGEERFPPSEIHHTNTLSILQGGYRATLARRLHPCAIRPLPLACRCDSGAHGQFRRGANEKRSLTAALIVAGRHEGRGSLDVHAVVPQYPAQRHL